MYSNGYIFRYSSIMVILVAAVLSTATLLLKPFQDRNIRVAKMQGILASANIESTAEDAIPLFDKYIKDELVINPQGDVTSIYTGGKLEKGEVKAFDINLKEELYDKSKGVDYSIPLFIADVNGDTVYIIPLYGKGLWGPVWGNIAVSKDCRTVVGVYFDHKSETPGLGAEINTKAFQQQFIGKQIFNDKDEFTSIRIVKGGINMLPEELRIHGVDAISGGTITSMGVKDMLNDCLENYVPFFKKHF